MIARKGLKNRKLLKFGIDIGVFYSHDSARHNKIHLTRAVPASRAEHAVPGGGRLDAPCSIPARIGRSEKRKKSVRKRVKKHFETTSVIFCLRSKMRSPEVKKCQIFPNPDMPTETPIYLGNYDS